MTREARLIIGILIADLVLLVVGVYGNIWLGLDPLRMLSFATASIGVVTFLGFFAVVYKPSLIIERALRNAIAASVIVMYLATVGITTFFSLIKVEQGLSGRETNPLTKTMIDSFQTVVTVVIGFYFTSAAVLEGIQRYKSGNVKDE